MWPNMNSTTSFEGGFLDTSQRGQTGDDDRKLRRAQTIVPVLIRHLTSASSVDEIKLWNIPARIFTLVGIVRHIDESTTKISYEVEDETGTITALKWLEADKRAPEPIMEINTYVRLHGLLREQSDKRHMLILRIWPLTNLNELTTHLLEVTYATLKAEAMAKKGIEARSERDPTNGKTDTEDHNTYFGMSADQVLIYKIIFAAKEVEAGLERSEIKAQVPKRLVANTDEILDFLVSEGHVYTTDSLDHFKAT